MILKRLSYTFASIKQNTSSFAESHMIIDPHFYQRRDLISKIQNHFANKSAFNDIQRSFRDFNRSQIKTKYLQLYNNFLEALKKQKFQDLQDYYLSPTLFKDFKKTMKAKEQLPYYFQPATSCELVQARGYAQSISNVKSTNKWFQLTLRYKLADGQDAYHILERSDKLKHFKYIKFYL